VFSCLFEEIESGVGLEDKTLVFDYSILGQLYGFCWGLLKSEKKYVLKMSAIVLFINPDNYSAFNWRREALLKEKEFDVQFERFLMHLILKVNLFFFCFDFLHVFLLAETSQKRADFFASAVFGAAFCCYRLAEGSGLLHPRGTALCAQLLQLEISPLFGLTGFFFFYQII
jgi:hypothetical protein